MSASVTTVIPSYNYGKFVVEAVESALAQDWQGEQEVIVVDDGSKDDTRQRLEPYFDRIKYIFQENKGLSAARNTGIRAAKGEWIAFLDADDVWHPAKTRLQLAVAAQGYQMVGSGGSTDRARVSMDGTIVRALTVRDFLLWTPVAPSGTMILRSCFDVVGGFDENLRSVEDRDMWLRVATKFACAQLDTACMFSRTHPNQMTGNAKRMFEAYRQVLDKFFREHPEFKDMQRMASAQMYMDSAVTYLEQGQEKVAFEFVLRSLASWPLPLVVPHREREHFRRGKLLVRAGMGEALFRRLRPVR
jgi:glycosyltransferase involved in cell wall biosynthesis